MIWFEQRIDWSLAEFKRTGPAFRLERTKAGMERARTERKAIGRPTGDGLAATPACRRQLPPTAPTKLRIFAPVVVPRAVAKGDCPL